MAKSANMMNIMATLSSAIMHRLHQKWREMQRE